MNTTPHTMLSLGLTGGTALLASVDPTTQPVAGGISTEALVQVFLAVAAVLTAARLLLIEWRSGRKIPPSAAVVVLAALAMLPGVGCAPTPQGRAVQLLDAYSSAVSTAATRAAAGAYDGPRVERIEALRVSARAAVDAAVASPSEAAVVRAAEAVGLLNIEVLK